MHASLPTRRHDPATGPRKIAFCPTGPLRLCVWTS